MKQLIAVAALLGVAAPAHADWQFTRWGMTVDEVTAAAPGKIVPFEHPGYTTASDVMKLATDYSANDIDFTAGFMFDRATGRLSRVHLEPKAMAACERVWFAMDAAYGPTTDRARSRTSVVAKWHDAAAGNVVTVQMIGVAPPRDVGYCSIDYSAAVDRAASGL